MENNNEYAEILDNDPALQAKLANPDNEYGEIINQDREAQAQALKQSEYVASKGNPDQKAKVLELAKRSKLPTDIVERNFDEILKQTDAKSFGDYAKIVDSTPGLAKWLQDPDNATLSKDDLDSLGIIEHSVKEQSYGSELFSAFKSGAFKAAAGLAKAPALTYGTDYDNAPVGVFDDTYSRMENAKARQEMVVPENLYKNDLTNYLDQKASDNSPKDMDASIITEAWTNGEYKKAGRALSFQIVSNLPQLFMLAATRGAGLGVMGVSSASDKFADNLEKGISPDVAKSNAAVTGALEAGIESLGGIGGNPLKGVVKDMAAKMGPTATKQLIKDSLKNILITSGEEGLEEFATSISQDLTDYAMGVNNDALDGIVTRAADSFLVGFGSGGLTKFPMESQRIAIESFGQRQKAASGKQAYLDIGEAATNSKLKGRSPEKSEEYIKQVTEGTPVESVFIPVEDFETFFQSKNIDPTQFIREVGALEAYNEAKETGSDIKIPFSQWASKVGGSEYYQGLANDIKFDAEEMTVNQIAKEQAAAREEIKQADKEAKAQEEEIQKQKVASTKKVVEDKVFAQISQLGIFDDKTSQTYGKIFGDKYQARAERRGLGEDAATLFEAANIQFNKIEPGGEQDTKSIFGKIMDSAKKAIGMNVQDSAVLAQGGNEYLQKGVEQAPEITVPEGFFEDPKGKGDVELPALNPADLALIGAESKPVIIKENIAGKNQENHSEIPSGHDIKILSQALYSPDMIIQSKPTGKPDYWTFIKSDGKSSVSVIEISKTKDSYEVVNWYQSRGRKVEQLKRRAEREGGLVLITERSKSQGAAGLSALPFSSDPSIAGLDRKGNGSLNQGAEQSPRGRIRFKAGVGAAIDLFSGHKDRSTIMHEAGHLWFEELIEDATTEGVPQQLRDDLDKMLKWAGLDVRSSDGAEAIHAAIQVDHHELIARGFEAYLMEGKAPTEALRKIFAKFKVWFIGIYKNVANLNVMLDDEIRGVMDRLVAGDDAINRVEQENHIEPLFFDPRAQGMSEEMSYKYLNAVTHARLATEEHVRTKLMEDIKKQEQANYREVKSQVKEDVKKDLQSSKVYQSLSILQRGKTLDGQPLPGGLTEIKISKESLDAQYGKDFAKQLPRGITSQEGLPLEMVAELLGYPTGPELVEAIRAAPPMKEAIAAEVEARMKDAYPDFLTTNSISNEAVKAYHNEHRAEMLALELQHLASQDLSSLQEVIRRVSRRVPSEKAIKEQAAAIIAKKTVKEISGFSTTAEDGSRKITNKLATIYQRAEAKASKEAGVLLAKGDIDGAFRAKRMELLNHELYKSAVAAQERVESDVKNFKKLFKKDEDLAKTRDVDMVNAARAVLAEHGILKSEKTADEYLEQMKSYDPDTYVNVMALVDSATENAKPYKTMSLDDFVTMSDTVSAIWDLSKSSREMEIDGQKIDRNFAISELQGRLSELIGESPTPGAGQAVTDAEKRTMGLLSVKNLVLRVEHWGRSMDKGDINGVFTKYIVRPILDATTSYRLKKVDTMIELRDIVKDLEIDNPKQLIDAGEIGYKFTKPELIMALLHTGNESNFKKLLVGRGWGSIDSEGKLDTSRWDTFIARAQMPLNGIITKSDMDVVQKIWDLNERLKPEAQKAHKRMYSIYFNEITAEPVQTPWGTYRGGYMPAIADNTISIDANIRAGQSIEDSPAQMFPTTGRGFTKARIENYSTPLSLDFSKIQTHIDKVLKFTFIEPAVKDAARLVNDKTFRKDLNAFDNDLANELLIPWLKRAATQKVTTPGLNKHVDRAASWFRRTSSIQFMVANVPNAIQNLTGIFPSMLRVNPVHLAGSFKRYMTNSKVMAEKIMEISPYMRSRSGLSVHDIQKEMDDIVLNPTKFESFRDEAISMGYVLERMTNGLVEMVVWDAAHNQAVANGLSAESAIDEADATVRQTQAAMNPEDIAKFEAGSPFVKLFTMFSGFFNTQVNLITTETKIAKEEGFTTKEGSQRLARAYFFALASPAIVGGLVYRVMSGKGLDEDDDGEYFDDFMDILVGAQFRYLTAMVPGGGVINSVMGKFTKNPYDDKISLSPAFSNLERAFGAIDSIPKAISGGGNDSKAIKDALSALGLATGLPAAPVAKPLGYIADVKSGKAKPSGPVDFSRGLVTGRPGGN